MAAGYVLKHSQTILNPTGTYTTATDLLTVPAGHLYLLKKVSGMLQYAAVTSTTEAYINLHVSDNAGANFKPAVPVWRTASNITATADPAIVLFDWTSPVQIDPTLAWPGRQHDTATVIATKNTYAFNYCTALKDMMLEAGQKLAYSPLTFYSGGTGTITVAGASSTALYFNISYIDYTL